MWTKEEIKMVIRYWEEMNTQDLAKKLGIEKSQLSTMAVALRKAGVKLSRKRIQGYIQPLIEEVKRELRIKA